MFKVTVYFFLYCIFSFVGAVLSTPLTHTATFSGRLFKVAKAPKGKEKKLVHLLILSGGAWTVTVRLSE